MSYALDPITGVLSRSGFSGINYSDGDEIETRLLSIVTAASDVSLFSAELCSACTDWASRYHFSAARANLLRPIADRLTGDVLELGAGCGAITRFLGENGANVMAVEGSARRAAIARARTRDLSNVAIALDDIAQCPIKQQFDVVTLIGVLEYAGLFSNSENPAQMLLDRCRAWLKPSGMLVVAIENQLGLKYFAGAPEDHVNIPNYGIEGRYKEQGPRTFGRQALADLLSNAGLPEQRWFAPFPDYKLPAAVISEAGLDHPVFDGGALAAQTANADPQLPVSLAFQPEPVWDVVFQNKLGLALSNSFLVLASGRQVASPSQGGSTIGWHFNTGRAAAYCKVTRFESDTDEADDVKVLCERLAPEASEPIQAVEGPLEFDLVPAAKYVPGRLLAADFQSLIGVDKWTIDAVTAFFCNYLEVIKQLAIERGMPVFPESLNDRIDGACFDWLPQNLMRTASGRIELIDEEWRYREDLPLGFLLFRAIRSSLVASTTLGIPSEAKIVSARVLIREVLSKISEEPLDNGIFEEWLQLEARVQQQVHGGLFDDVGFLQWFDQPLSNFSRRIESQNHALRLQLKNLEQSFDLIVRSRAWALTAPLRRLHDWLRSSRIQFHNSEIAASSLPKAGGDVDIIVCVHNALEDVQRCLDSLLRNTPPPWRLILVDDGSDRPTAEALAEFASAHDHRVAHIRHDEAKGYTYAANAGLRMSAAEHVVLLNSDTIVTPNWLPRLIACAKSDKTIGLVGPVSNCASWQSVPAVFNNSGDDWAINDIPAGWSLDRYSAQVAKQSIPIWPRVGFLNGFCLLIKRQLINSIGLFDEAGFGCGYGEENDYCLRAAEAGWSLAVADDCYIYHAQSKSYSDEQRAELVPLADETLHRKHAADGQVITQLIRTQHHLALAWLRARVDMVPNLQKTREQLRVLGIGQRVLFVLPSAGVGGGSNIILLEAACLRGMGVDAQIANLATNREAFEASYPRLDVPVNYFLNISELNSLAKQFDAVFATLYLTVDWLAPLANDPDAPVIAYYVQDYEPAFFPTDDPEHARAKASYTAISDIRIVTKTAWTRDQVKNAHGVNAEVIGPSYDDRCFYPAAESHTDSSVRIVAMVRPSTPRRNPEATMRVLKQLAGQLGSKVRIIIFGVEENDAAFLALERDFPHENYGELGVESVADLLRSADLFFDASTYQAMGLTAMEAMASGAVVVGPQEGGLAELICDQENGVLVDTTDEAQMLAALVNLVNNGDRRREISMAALSVVRHVPEHAARRLIKAIDLS